MVQRRALGLLSTKDQRKISKIVLIQILLNLLDLIGLALVGLIASLTSAGVKSEQPSNIVSLILDYLNLDSLSFQVQTALLASITVFLFVSRSVLSIFVTRKMFYFLGNYSSKVASDMFQRLLDGPLTLMEGKSRQQLVYSLTTGIEVIFLKIIGPTAIVVADVALLLIVLTGISLVSLPMTFISVMVIGATVFTLHMASTSKAKILGNLYSSFDIVSREIISDSLISLRDIKTKKREKYFVDDFFKNRLNVSNSFAQMNFIPVQSKYIIESSIVLTGFIVSGFQFLITNAQNAITTLSIFLVAGSRLAPAALRIQQGIVGLNNSWGIAESTFTTIHKLETQSHREEKLADFSDTHVGFSPTVLVDSLSFSYPTSHKKTLKNISFAINPGEIVGVIGPSGAGKSTLLDLVLGLRNPDQGQILISGLPPALALQKWPGGVSYIPQEIHLFNKSLLCNVALGFHDNEIDESKVWEALKDAQLVDFVKSLPHGIHTKLGEKGVAISGGQRQRIGIARAFYTKPLLLIMDEATNSLDAETEYNLTEFLNSLKGKVSILMIAHKLTSIKGVDRIILLEKGQITFQGPLTKLNEQGFEFTKYLNF
jgi:ATP-binding cassette subfamily C protein